MDSWNLSSVCSNAETRNGGIIIRVYRYAC